MSAGTPVRSVRIGEELWVRMRFQICSRNNWTREEPWNESDFIRIAIEEKLAKMARSRNHRPSATSDLFNPNAIEENVEDGLRALGLLAEETASA